MSNRIPVGAVVRTLADDGSDDWNAEGRAQREFVPRGIEGYVVDISDSHQGHDPSCGIMTGGWYCEACDLAIADWEVEDGSDWDR